MFGNVKKPVKPVVIRKVSVARPTDQPAPSGNVQRRPLPTQTSSSAKNGVVKVKDAVRRAGSAPASGLLSVKRRQDSKTASPSPSLSPSRRSSGSHKRKAPDPSATPDFGSSSEEESSGDEAADGSRKRMRPTPRTGTVEPDMKRVVLDDDALKSDGELQEEEKSIHGHDLTVGKFKEYQKYMSATGEDDGKAAIAELQYPSKCKKERFQLVLPTDPADYNPVEDIIESIVQICREYFPEKQAEFLTDEITGYPRRFRKAYRERSGPQFLAALEDFNAFITKSVNDDTIPNFLRTRHNLPLSLVERILSQVYARTVSPQVSILKQYENGTDDVYGELLPRFVHQIFLDTNLRSDQVFVDLGSGVGNVVLQAALEIGCESWGIERMPNPSGLAAKQVAEFVPRCKRWALKPGKATVLQGDFLQSLEIDEVLRRADVILVNNQAFTPALNGALTMKFLDLKDGCKIVSLRSFLPENWQIRERNLQDPRNLLISNLKKEYFSGSVSWTDQGGNYYVATKDVSKLEAFSKRQQEMREAEKQLNGDHEK
ncbi:uncharacterized protein PV09_05035 [Verruconis gallopava]|uniref:Histone-lysine N-methyltransferase, H3 lysine-79 specific n=1 Tax=Verruconis gallopava TaxID=253628 RepID=A0A0D1XMI6_9PEZI|nr:uncharacterized protein PV09_05035 [Verruconis gallopava]KIW03726.1 hypothetical protein PV09_05035 [Verruconis gallopava]